MSATIGSRCLVRSSVRPSRSLLWIDCYPHLEILLLILLYTLYPRPRKVFRRERVSYLPSARAHLIPVSIQTGLCRFPTGTKRNWTNIFWKNNKNKRDLLFRFIWIIEIFIEMVTRYGIRASYDISIYNMFKSHY